jgi:hypothetical protein
MHMSHDDKVQIKYTSLCTICKQKIPYRNMIKKSKKKLGKKLRNL